ncbi:ferric reductase family protein [Phanerochaete sordida]|uniref:ferric-chelate reductase (NADPH) n=1 Tax=Phanerochaete sordida TaxID=48140 RepID=A0A9P3GBF2_9APHY|nr:ferric reductase family protein [Phanerochaete sordida]
MGKIWLLHPILWHSSRDPVGYDYTKMTDWQIKMLRMKWHDWYQADWSYGQTTVEFFCAGIGTVMLLYFAFLIRSWFAARSKKPIPRRANALERGVAIYRYFTSKQVRIKSICYYAPPMGSVIGVAGIFTFVMAFSIAVRPYYWPNSEMGSSPPLATRSGWISIAIMPFMIAFATKVNYVGILTGASHERLQVYHRWSATFMYITSLMHTFPFIHYNIQQGVMVKKYNTQPWYWSGVAALVPQTWLILMSWGIIRSRYYELFKKLHFCAAGIFMVALFIHCDFRLTSWDYFWATLAIYTTTWLIQVGRTLFYGALGVPYTLKQLGDPSMIKVTIHAPHRFWWAPGQHVFIRFLTGGWLLPFSTHPFTISNIRTPGAATHDVEIVFRVRGGLTKQLADLALARPNGRLLLDGPYGGVPVSLHGFDRVYLLAGGSGSTFVMPLLQDLARAFGSGMRCKHVTLVVAYRHPGTRPWLEPYIAEAARRAAETGTALAVHIHVTADGADLEAAGVAGSRASSGSSVPTIAAASVGKGEKALEGAAVDSAAHLAVPEVPTALTHAGRPDLPAVVREACASPLGGRVAFAVCGPDAFVYDVRNAVGHCQMVIADGYSPCQEAFLHAEAYDW